MPFTSKKDDTETMQIPDKRSPFPESAIRYPFVTCTILFVIMINFFVPFQNISFQFYIFYYYLLHTLSNSAILPYKGFIS